MDGHNYPNLPLMKLSAWHKKQGDSVEWYQPLLSGHMDRVYMSKVFSFSPDYPYHIDANEIIKGGSGYHIKLVNGKEIFEGQDRNLPDEIEHIYPDYSIYPQFTETTAYGFLSRGCPRGCSFCHVAAKEGKKSRKVADLSEFFGGGETKKYRIARSQYHCLSRMRGLIRTACREQSLCEFQPGNRHTDDDGAKSRIDEDHKSQDGSLRMGQIRR